MQIILKLFVAFIHVSVALSVVPTEMNVVLGSHYWAMMFEIKMVVPAIEVVIRIFLENK